MYALTMQSIQRPRGRMSLGSASILNQMPIHPVPPSQRMLPRGPLSTNQNIDSANSRNTNTNTNSQPSHSNQSRVTSMSETSASSEDHNIDNQMVRNSNRMRRTRKRARSQPATSTVMPAAVNQRNETRNITPNVVGQRVLPENTENDMGISNQAVDLNVVDNGDILGELQSDESVIVRGNHEFEREPPRKRRRTAVSSSAEYKKILKLKVKLLDTSLQQKDNIIGHYNTLIHQKDSVVDQKDGVIRQKDDLIDTYKSIVSMGRRQ